MLFAFTISACSEASPSGAPPETQEVSETESAVEPTAAPSVEQSDADIGEEAAKAIALKRVPGAAESDIISFEREIEDGYAEYEGEIYFGGVEYEFEILAENGTILSWEVDRD